MNPISPVTIVRSNPTPRLGNRVPPLDRARLGIFSIVFIFVCSVFLSSCSSAEPGKDNNATVSKTGTLTMKSGEEYLLRTDEGIVNMTSNKVDLDSYLKKKVTVTGQFSGSTLYVDEIAN